MTTDTKHLLNETGYPSARRMRLCRRRFGRSVIVGLGLVVVAAVSGCTRPVYLPVESVHTQTVREDNAELLTVIQQLTDRLTFKERQIDSLLQSNSELIVLSQNGDTLRHDRERIVYRTSRREIELTRQLELTADSLRQLRRQLESTTADTIRIPYPVEKKLSKWEQTKMELGGIAIGILSAVLAAVVVWLIIKIRGNK